jgi:hypothetical protein
MSEHRRVSMDGMIEPKDMKRYIRETRRICPTCGKANMWIKLQEEATVMLECPNCDLVEHLPLGFDVLPPTPPASPVRPTQPAPQKKDKKK